MCGLRTRLRTDVDPSLVELPSAGGAYRLAAPGAITCLREKESGWHEPDKHLVDEDAERPPVDGLVVSFALYDLRRQVLRRPAQRPRSIQSSTNIQPENRLSIDDRGHADRALQRLRGLATCATPHASPR